MIKRNNKNIALFLSTLITLAPVAAFADDNVSNTKGQANKSSIEKNSEINSSKETEENIRYNVGWVQNSDGSYYLYDGLGDIVKSSWCKVGGKWYYLKDDGKMATGWVKNEGSWYYVGQWGNMHKGWIKDGGLWYYLNEDGIMQRGWVYSNNSWYYLNEYGAMVTNAVIDGYKLGPDGVCE
ncbi:hypothetical protein [Clostridium butyricum]|uniref:hypothetical protein n=1 Tax=Clostridium butyricum TaxID=1492 RepID=UPI00168B3050|nr:hypothetical protein [Clostridium butyricum]MDB2150370.1 hypothetical protein [Clostridium butyricum]